MLPIVYDLGPVAIHSYGLMMAVGFIVALFFIQRDAEKAGLDPKVLGDLTFWSLLVGLAGARVLHVFMFPEGYSWSSPLGWIAVWKGGLVFQGALPPVLVFIYVYLRKHKTDPWKSLDVIMPYVALGHGIGRVGCFFNGCCYGNRTDLPWGIPFRRVPWDTSVTATGSPAFLDHFRRYGELSATDHWSYPVHPTQLYSLIALVGLCLLMLYLRKKWHPFDGFLLPFYFAVYGVYRFFVEFLRGDHNPTSFGSLSDQQLFSILLFALGLGFFLYFYRRAQLRKSS